MGGKTSTSTQSVQIPPEVLARYNAVNKRAEEAASQPFQEYSNDPNAFVAPINTTQQTGINQTLNASQQAQPYFDAATGMTAAGSGAVNPDQLQTAQYMNPYTQNVVDATTAALQQQQGQQLSQQQTQAIKSGAFGGNRSGLERAVLQGQQGLATAQAISPLYQRGYEQALATAVQQQGVNLGAQQANQTRLLQGGQQLAGLGAAAQTAGLQGANAVQQAGATQQQTTQAGLGALYNQWLQKQGYPYQQAQFLANIAEGTGSLSGSTTTTNQPAPFFSDRRLKHDVKRIGETDKGLPIYSFKYKDDPEEHTHIGFMADEVEKRHPEDVGLAGGYKTVDYEDVADKESRPHRYDGGLVPDSAGGAVLPEMSGEGYAEGGMAGASDFVPPMRSIFGNPGAGGNAGLAQVLAAQQGSGQRKLMMPSQGLKPITPEFNQLLGAGQQVADLGGLAGKGWDTGKSALLGSEAYKDSKTGKDIAATTGLIGSGGSSDNAGYLNKIFSSSPGMAGGGGVNPYSISDDPMADVVKEGDEKKHELMKPNQAPGAPPSPFSQIMGGVGAATGLAKAGTTAMEGLEALGEFLPALFLANGGVAGGRKHYDDGGDVPPETVPPIDYRSMLVNSANKAGIDPDNYVRVAQAESSLRPRYGDDGSSGGILQFHVGDVSEKYPHAGLGNAIFKDVYPELDKSLSPQEKVKWLNAPENQQALSDYGAQHIAKNGYGAWTTARQMGLAGGRGSQSEASAPSKGGFSGISAPDTFNNQPQGWGDFLTSKQFVLPLLSGLGKMAGSNSRYLGSALLQGLGGAAESYENLQNQTSQIQLRQSEIAKNTLGMLKDRFIPIPTGTGQPAWRDTMTGKILNQAQFAAAMSGAASAMGNATNVPYASPVSTKDPIQIAGSTSPGTNAVAKSGEDIMKASGVTPESAKNTAPPPDAFANVADEYNPYLLTQKAEYYRRLSEEARTLGRDNQSTGYLSEAEKYEQKVEKIMKGDLPVLDKNNQPTVIKEIQENINRKNADADFAKSMATQRGEFNKTASTFLDDFDPQLRIIMDLSRIYQLNELGRGSQAIADLVGLARRVPYLNEILRNQLPNLDAQQSGYDTAQKEALTMAFATIRDAQAQRAPATALKEAVLTVANPSMAPKSRWDLLTGQVGKELWQKAQYEDWINADRPDHAKYLIQWKKDPKHSIDNYVEQARAMIPEFKGISPTERQQTRPLNTNNQQPQQQTSAPAVTPQMDQQAIQWAQQHPTDPKAIQILKANGVQ